jgi:hypothetical protein
VASPAPTPPANWSFLWGKRRFRRHRVALKVEVHARIRFWAEVVDVSAGGVLLRAPAESFAEAGGKKGGFAFVAEALADPFVVRFSGKHVHGRARLVRVAWQPDGTHCYYFGCRFEQPLNSMKLRRLGLSPRECGPESGIYALPADRMPHQANEHAPLSMEIRDPEGDEDAVYRGLLLGANGRALATDLPPGDPTEFLARLGGRALEVSVTAPNGNVLWTERAYLLSIRMLDPPTMGISIIVLAVEAPPAAVVRRLVARGSARRRRRSAATA